MNAAPFPGNGMRADGGANITMRHENINDDSKALMSEALAENMASELPTPSVSETDRGIFERSIAARRAEKAKQQAIAAAAMAKARQLTASIRSMEDALDSLLTAES